MTLKERFEAKVPAGPGCMAWMGALDHKGYGRFSVKGINKFAHRIAFELYIGPIGEGLTIDHLCRSRRCQNISHMEAVTMRTNCLRGDCWKHQAKKTHCRNGHPFNHANTYRYKNGHRSCRLCSRRHSATYRKRLLAR